MFLFVMLNAICIDYFSTIYNNPAKLADIIYFYINSWMVEAV